MNRRITLALGKVERMREHFAGTQHEAGINELADQYTKLLTNPHGVEFSVIQLINSRINSLGVR